MIQPRSCRDAAIAGDGILTLLPYSRCQTCKDRSSGRRRTIVRCWYYLFIGCIAAFFGAAQAQALACADTAVVAQRLAQVYGERRQFVATGPDGAVTAVYAATDTGSWTITITRPDGQACLVASGAAFDWQDVLSRLGRNA